MAGSDGDGDGDEDGGENYIQPIRLPHQCAHDDDDHTELLSSI